MADNNDDFTDRNIGGSHGTPNPHAKHGCWWELAFVGAVLLLAGFLAWCAAMLFAGTPKP